MNVPLKSTMLAPLDLSPFFDKHPVLETERLLLRPITIDDKEAIYDFYSDPEIMKYRVSPLHKSIEDTVQFIETDCMNFAERKRIRFGIALKASGTLIGTGGFHSISPEHHRLEIGYSLRREFWGQGYMTEAVTELIRFAFEDMGMHRIMAMCDLGNDRSARVMERCGMTFEGTLKDYALRRGKFVTVRIYAILKEPPPSFAKEGGEDATRRY